MSHGGIADLVVLKCPFVSCSSVNSRSIHSRIVIVNPSGFAVISTCVVNYVSLRVVFIHFFDTSFGPVGGDI